jgi:hypothetical protein
LNVSGIGTALILWTVLKAQSHWQVFSKANTGPGEKLQGIKEIYLGILFSMLSMLWAIIIGFYASTKPWPKGSWAIF